MSPHIRCGQRHRRRLPKLHAVILAIVGIALVHQGTAAAQTTTLPAASRSVFKCEESGKVIYSDQPCLGAERLTIQPTRGLNKATGKERVGSDVAREHRHETFVEAVKPLTGMDQAQFDKASRRTRLDSRAKAKCNVLDTEIARLESQKKASAATERSQGDIQLLEARTQYRNIGC